MQRESFYEMRAAIYAAVFFVAVVNQGQVGIRRKREGVSGISSPT